MRGAHSSRGLNPVSLTQLGYLGVGTSTDDDLNSRPHYLLLQLTA